MHNHLYWQEKTLAVKHDGCFGDPCKFAWGRNNARSLLLTLFSLSLSSHLGLAAGGSDCHLELTHTSSEGSSPGISVIFVEKPVSSNPFCENELKRQNTYTHWDGWGGGEKKPLYGGRELEARYGVSPPAVGWERGWRGGRPGGRCTSPSGRLSEPANWASKIFGQEEHIAVQKNLFSSPLIC